jgi:hypothetical protein
MGRMQSLSMLKQVICIYTVTTGLQRVNSALALLRRVVVGDVANISEVRAASIFKVKVCVLVSLCV